VFPMAIKFHPKIGAICYCDFTRAFVPPEMQKRRPVIVLSSPNLPRSGLVTVVPTSTTPPAPVRNFHYLLKLEEPLPSPYNSPEMWVKADMLYSVSFDRLSAIPISKDANGNRKYRTQPIPKPDLMGIQRCVLASLNLGFLTQHVNEDTPYPVSGAS